jgi:peptidoglycan/xylan/chitin deacetylase (PgdA/CDA1 family)
MRVIMCLLSLFLATAAQAQPAGHRFVAIAFHDVVDRREDLATDSVASDQLVRFFDWLKGNGWTVVSLDDVAAAARGARPLPDKAILLSFDDGYRSLYTRVFPLLRIYRYPAVAALVGAWMEGPPNGTVRYGDRDVPRSTFISWAEAREMQGSGLVEFASHSYDMHRGIPANPQGNLIAAARTWRYDPAVVRYEDDPLYRARVFADLTRSSRQIAAALGRAPRTLVWPYGRFSEPAQAEAKAAGFSFAFTLEAESANAGETLAIHRYFPSRNPALGEIADNLRFDVEYPDTARVACIALDGLAVSSGAAQDAALGTMIESLRALGANKIVIDGQAALPTPDAALGEVFFPTLLRPLKADILSRAAWQIRSRADVEVYVHLPLQAATAAVGEAAMPALYADMLRHAAADGIVLEAPPQPPSPGFGQRNAVRARRAALDPATLDPASRRALAAYRAAAGIEPLLRLMLAVPSAAGPADWADYVLLPPAPDADALVARAARLQATGWLRPEFAGHVVQGIKPTQLEGMRRAQRLGAAGFALCPGMPTLPAPAALSAAFSSAIFAHRP